MIEIRKTDGAVISLPPIVLRPSSAKKAAGKSPSQAGNSDAKARGGSREEDAGAELEEMLAGGTV